jgi:hypothetical protein
MKTATICHEIPCDHSVAERPRYFPRQLITPDDLNLEQEYFRAKLRWHNRMLHGWGVVCGARVCLVPKSKENGAKYEPWKVSIRPGYILGPYGDEIIIDCARTFDVRTRGLTGITGEPCVDVIDPWCSEVIQTCDEGTLYVAVKYKEIAARPVRVQPVGCGCDDSACENSRLVDGYEISVLNYCPDSHQTPPNIDDLTKGPIPDCPPCPDEPWVVLAKVDLDADGNIIKIDNCVCRRLVVSLAGAWWHCTEPHPHPHPTPQPTPQPTPSPAPGPSRPVKVVAVKARATLAPGVQTEVEMKGENLDQVAKVSFGQGIKVKDVRTPSGEKLTANLAVEATAQPGKRTLVLADNAGKELLKMEGAIEIVAGASPPGPVKPTPHGGGSRSSRTAKRRKKVSDEEV